MAMTIVGVKNFKTLKKAYDSTSLSIYSRTKMDILKNLVILAEKREELEELEDIIEHLKKYYQLDENNYEIKKKIKESVLLFEDKKRNLNNNNKTILTSKERGNIIIVKEGFDFSKLDNINKPKDLSDDNNYSLNEAEEIINNFSKTPNKITKGSLIKKFLFLNISFDDLLFLYKKYGYHKNKLIRIIPKKMFEKAQTKDNWLELYKISSGRDKNYRTILINAEIKKEFPIKSKREFQFIDSKDSDYWIKEFFKDKDKRRKSQCLRKLKDVDISFQEALTIYKKSSKSCKLKNTILCKMNEKAETFEEKLIVYSLTGLKFSRDNEIKEKLINDLFLLINTPEDFKKAEKIIPKISHFWYHILKKKIEKI